MSQNPQQDVFVSNTLPDIDPESHIIGLVCVHDEDDNAEPSNDGWFLSDFYMFNHLLAGQGQRQRWYTCVDPHHIVKNNQELAHDKP
ncbi:MAG: hypothetical protein M1823_005617 [Watsoniomyces obsoletus]|nr:MAG: hypothetical protein M1823_005617 [Watsoniomyces obsoletus]